MGKDKAVAFEEPVGSKKPLKRKRAAEKEDDAKAAAKPAKLKFQPVAEPSAVGADKLEDDDTELVLIRVPASVSSCSESRRPCRRTHRAQAMGPHTSSALTRPMRATIVPSPCSSMPRL